MDMKSSPKISPPKTSVDIHIHRLVVHGLDVHDRAALGAAVEAEIGRLFLERGWPGTIPVDPVELGRIAAPDLKNREGVKDTGLGIKIGTSVYEALRS